MLHCNISRLMSTNNSLSQMLGLSTDESQISQARIVLKVRFYLKTWPFDFLLGRPRCGGFCDS